MDDGRSHDAPQPGLPLTIPYYLAEQIKRDIIHGRHPPGANLREQDLGATYGSSRGPVREALRLLELQGLVTHSPRRGFRVTQYSEADVEHLYQLRATLEGLAIDDLADKEVADLVIRLNESNKRMRRFVRANDITAYFDENIRFHAMIADASGNKPLIRLLSMLNDMSLPLRYLLVRKTFPSRSEYFYHEEITSLIDKRDFAAAKARTQEHIVRNVAEVKQAYFSS